MVHALYQPLLMASITTASILTGCLFSLSYLSVSTLLNTAGVAEAHLLSQWKTAFRRGFRICPTSATFSSFLCFINAFLAYRHEANMTALEESSSNVLALIIAGLLMIGIVPYTLSLIVPTEEVMLKREAKLRGKTDVATSDESAAETRRLMKRWVALNYGRTALPLMGVLVAWTAW